jgi:CHAT domain-containing protein
MSKGKIRRVPPAAGGREAEVGSYAIRALVDDELPLLHGTRLDIQNPRRVRPLLRARGDVGQPDPVTLRNDDLVRVVFDGGAHIWMRADELRALRERPLPDQRAAATQAGGPDLVSLDLDMTGSANRGLLSLGVKLLECFGVDLHGMAATRLAAAVDAQRLLMHAEGLFRCPLQSAQSPLLPLAGPLAPVGQPLLVFIHGTFSHFSSAFGDLMAVQGGPGADAASALRQGLQQRYGERIFAFEHQTLTRSPIVNALNLVRALPVGAELHLVTHSRGGLIGELLALAQRSRGADPLSSLITELFEAADPQRWSPAGLPALGSRSSLETLRQAYQADARALRELLALMDAKRLRISRFVRVACPARGTTLASARLDRWLGLLHSVMPQSFAGDALDFLLAVLKERTDARVMPGIEAMMPGSPLIRLLNAGIQTDADLSVVAGDTQGGGVFSSIKTLVADWFYADDNDLVVNTGSMSGGLARADGRARAIEDRGPEVTHGRYFANADSLGWLRQGLLCADGEPGDFKDINAARHAEPLARTALALRVRDAGARPIVVLLPDAMGSSLQADGDTVWLNPHRLKRAGLSRLRLKAGPVHAVEPLDGLYGPLIEHLSRTWHVVTVPYDWRLSLRHNATMLRECLPPLLQRAQQQGVSLHVLAHGSGGLVARSMLTQAAGRSLWKAMGALAAGPGRLLMLGTPNHGSMEALRWLTGCSPSLARLALLDFSTGVQDLMRIVRTYPGLVELLPFGTPQAQALMDDRALWARWRALYGVPFDLISAQRLQAARSVWQALARVPVDPQRMLYVAGCAPATVEGCTLHPAAGSGMPGLHWTATREGDGTVTWDSGRLPQLPMWFAADTAHDELCRGTADTRLFEAYGELLTTGQTRLLPGTPPPPSAGERIRFPLLQPLVDAAPAEDEILRLGLGPARAARRTPQSAQPRLLRLTVRHGDLRVAASHPVVVGHYQGDLLVSAERALDRALGRALQRAMDLGVHPGRSGTHMSFLAKPSGPSEQARSVKGALVIGLGQVGELSARRLRAQARDAFVDHARQCLQHQGLRSPEGGIGLSCLLVGSAGAGLSVAESLESLVRAALDANRRLEQAGLGEQLHLAELEIVELFEDLAVAAGHALHGLRQAADIAGATRWKPAQVQADPAHGGLRRCVFDGDRGWDLRVEIVEDTASGQLRYAVAGQRARAEQQLATGQLALAEESMARATADTDSRSEIGKALYEMLLPVDFRLSPPDSRGLVLLLDERSARFPWELLEDRWGANQLPLAVETSLVRQLKTVAYRPAPLMASKTSVLVIGDPQLSGWDAFDPLPGAQAEAAQVARQFEAALGQGPVKALLGQEQATTRAIIQALHERPWRVLHLAAHGVHGWREHAQAPARSGMVIGKRVFLQAGDLEQLRHVPELVFINCCELGRTLPADAWAGSQVNHLAANLAVACIRMGVRAVVASGWAVDDAAGVTFATTFYAHLLQGANLRDAVHAARQQTHRQHPDVNTWGAYQCYGEPGWRLVLSDRPGTPRPAAPLVSAQELVVEIDNLHASWMAAGMGPDDAPARHRQRVDRLAALARRAPSVEVWQAWQQRTDVAQALAKLQAACDSPDRSRT